MKALIFLLVILFYLVDISPNEITKLNQRTTDFKDKSQMALLKFKHKNMVPGVSFALFDSSRIIMNVCYGKSTYGDEINDSTLFSIQSISKNITTLAIMSAIQDGLLDLDTPVTKYLPDFKINSCFEDHPEQKINLRLILSHQAGFTHEAPIGNNYDFNPCDLQDHINSISGTWLKFPVGSNYSYSNLGFDLATEILSSASGMSFNKYLRTKIFQPAGMPFTTTDDKEVIQTRNKTEGNIRGLKSKHYPIPLPGSGAVYTNLVDFIRYTQILMNYGEINNCRMIDKKYLLEMFKIKINNYGLGTYINKSDGILYINHNGGGFGYSSTLLWFPEYNLGSVILCNKPCNTFDLCLSIMKDYIHNLDILKDEKISALFNGLNNSYFENKSEIDRYKSFKCKCDTNFKSEWKKYAGKYYVEVKGMELKWWAKIARSFGLGFPKIKIAKEGNLLKCYGFTGEGILREFEPGLFFTEDNEVLDLRSDKMKFRNILIHKR